MTRILLAFVAMFGLVFSPVSHADGERIAVLELRGAFDDDVLSLMTDEVRGGVLDVVGDEFIVMTRENMAMIAQDMGLDFSCVEGACEVETGRNLNAAYVVSGEVVTVGESLNLVLKLHETKRGALRKKQRTKASTVDALVDAAGGLARALTHQGFGLPGKPVGAAAVPSGGQAFGGYQGGISGEKFSIADQLKEQDCDETAQKRGKANRERKLATLENDARAGASAAWKTVSSRVKGCEKLDRDTRVQCMDQIKVWLDKAQAIPVGIKAGTEEVETECGIRWPAFREQSRTIEASEVSAARSQLRRLQAANVAPAATPRTQASSRNERSTSSKTVHSEPDPTFHRVSLRAGFGLDYGGLGGQAEFRPSEHWSLCLGVGGLDEFVLSSLGARWRPISGGNMYFQAMGGVGSHRLGQIGFNSLTVGSASLWKRLALDANIGVGVGYAKYLDDSSWNATVTPSFAIGVGRNIRPK